MMVVLAAEGRAHHDRLVQVKWRGVEDGQRHHDGGHHDPRALDDPGARADQRGHHGGVRERGGGWRQVVGGRGAQLGEWGGAPGRGAAHGAVGGRRGRA